MKTRAALFYGPGEPMRMETVDIEPPRDDDVLVRMVAAGVCGSDLHVVRGEWNRPLPMVLGHKGAGIVEARRSPDRAPHRRRRRDALVGTLVPGVRLLPARTPGGLRQAA